MFNTLAYSHFLHYIIPHYLKSLDFNEKLSQKDNADRLLLESQIHNNLQGDANSFLEISAPAMKLVPQTILSSFPYEDSKKKYIIQSHPSLLTDVIPYIADEFLRKKLYLHVIKSFSSNIQEVNHWIKSLRAHAKKKGFKSPIESRNIPLLITDELLQTRWDKSSWHNTMLQWEAFNKHLKVDGHKAWNREYCFQLLEKNHSVFSREKVMNHIHDVLRVQYDVDCIREENHWTIYQNGVHYGSLEFITGEHVTITELNDTKHCRIGIYQYNELLSVCGVYELWRAYYAMLAVLFKDESILMFKIEHLEDATLNSYSVKDVSEKLEELKNIGSVHYYHRERLHVRDVLTQYYALGSSGKIQDAYKKAFEYTHSEYEDIAYDILGLYESLWDYPYINI